ncbi:PLP-dependent aminotransferase family protein [Cryptosporangium arvum]|uniref:Transcriptional regulator with HTH domain and aminotransferase domain n=1 Tax=Cryptosporangium arvum DSM 44712 TaxID=927661 RepID=A0A010ZTB7_9ACTN|nr:PLP-dependent aminotransferase family protein [Cryptosporangium arvum]EXG81949.1 transcriptional regulator with HTH domain and aminotransferase domain [Cryptosporangium arvum DSM 44712]
MPELLLDLGGARSRAALEHRVRDAIRGGRLRAGVALPPSRVLARDLGLARNTVADAYAQLVAEGWLVARQGAGTWVAAGTPGATRRPAETPAEPATRFDLRPGRPDVASFPRTAWAAAGRTALRRAPSEAFDYPDPRGRPELRAALAHYLGRVRQVDVDVEHLVVVSGYTQAVALVAEIVGGGSIVLEDHGFGHHRWIVERSGATVHFAAAGRPDEAPDADAVFVTPAHQFPLGVALAPERRLALLERVRRTGGFVVEDDYDGEFRYDRKPVGALQGLDPARVVYVGTASKSLAPAVGLAWMAVPDALLDRVVEAKTAADRFTGALEQLTLAEFLTSGGYERHVRRSRLRYRRRRDHLLAALTPLPGLRVSGIAAGLHALVEFTDGRTADDEPALVAAAAAHGVRVQGLGELRHVAGTYPAALVLGYGTPPDHDYRAAVDAVVSVLATRRPARSSGR